MYIYIYIYIPAGLSSIIRRREHMVGVNMVLAEYHQNTLN